MKARKIPSRAARKSLFSLSSIGSAVAVALIATGAQAAETSVNAAYTPAVTGAATDDGGGVNAANVTATITSATVGTTSTGTPGNPNPVAMGTVGNLIGASATGNAFANSIAAPLNNDATLGVSTNTGVISSSVTGSKMAVESSTLQSGSVVNTDNTISATTTINGGTSVVSGNAAAGPLAAQPGTAVLTYPAGAPIFDAKGNVVVTNLQSATGASSSASVAGNTVDLLLTANAGNIVTATTALDRNSVLAVFKGNSATSTAEILPGGTPTFAGSAVVSNLQANGNGILATHSANNLNSTVMGIVSGAPAGGFNQLQGTLSVQDNTIASTATGNEALGATAGVAGNRILIDGVAIAGAGTAATAVNNSTHNGVGVVTNVNSDLAIVNSQGNIGVSTAASTTNGQVLAGAQSVVGSAVTLEGNSITASGTGNTASSAIASGKTAASFTGTAALSNQQANASGANVSGTVNGAIIAAQTGDAIGQTNGSTVSVADNRSAATAQGNQVSQSLSIEANTVALGSSAAVLTGGTSSDGRVSAAGAATITNLQGNYGGGATAVNSGSKIGLTANSGGLPIANNTLSLNDNRQEAVALGNGATNTLALAGNAVGTGAGIASVQMGDAAGSVGAVLVLPEARIGANGNVSGGAIALTDNLQRAIAYGNSASNTVGVKAGNVAVAPGATPASSVTVAVGNPLPFDNTLATQPTVTAAYGILNDQAQQSTVGTTVFGVNSLAVTVGGNVTAGSVANDRNALVAASYGNDAANGLSITANNLASTVPGAFASVANVTNTQAVGGAATRIEATSFGGTVVRTTVAGNLGNSSVSSSGNMTEALAIGSRATGNTVSVKGNNINTAGLAVSGALLNGTVLSTNASFSVQNAQSGQGTVAATRSGGAEVLTQITGTIANSKVDADGNTTLASATSNSANNGVAIDALGVSTTSAVQNLQITNASVTSDIGAGPTLADKGGVRVVVGGASVQGAQISVDSNVVGGSSTGNTATNSVDVKGNSIAVGNGFPLAAASNVAGLAGVVADHALSNDQLVIGTAPISSKVAAAFGVDTAPGAVIGGSTLSASNNTQSAKAVANTATNSIALAATSVSARAALQSAQGSLAAVESRSSTQAFAPASVSGSSVRIDGNGNTALAVINDVSNKLSIAADSTTGSGIPAIAVQGTLPGNTTAVGDQLIVNRQSATTSASSTADSAFYNEDRAVPANSGLVNSSFSISGNTTFSEASTNRATNATSLAGGATQGAKTAVLNAQDSSALVTANANNVSRLTLTGANALTGSSATLSGNTTGGAATGSAATNSLDIKGSTIAAGLPFQATALTGPGSAIALSGDHVLGNVQLGNGAVSSTVTGSVGIDTAPLSSVAGSTLSVTNNSQSAKAVANTALNSVSLAGANVLARSALQSTQSGLAPVTASSTSELFAPAASSASTVRISGNSNTALGVINDVTNTLAVTAVNTLPAGATGSVSLSETGSADNLVAAGDHVLSNRQTAASAVSGTASTSIYNDDRAVPGTQGLLNGSLTISGNSTFAEASANRAANTATVASDATQGAAVGIVNAQGSSATVSATATTAAIVTLAGNVPLNSSSVSLDGNTTSALARGNAATNVLTSSAGSSYGGAATVGSSSLAGAPLALNATASAAVLNSQTNSGAVTAASVGTSYQVALNSVAGAGTSNGTVGVSGNTLAAQAYGNSAVNRVTQTALNTGAPSAAIGNYQVNTGAVTATVTSVNFGIGVSGSVGNSTLRTTGNQITASATGNSAVSSIAAR